MKIPDVIYDADNNEYRPYLDPETERQLGYLVRPEARVEAEVHAWDVVYCADGKTEVLAEAKNLQWAWGRLMIEVRARRTEEVRGVLSEEALAEVMPVIEPSISEAEEERRYRALQVAAIWGGGNRGYTSAGMLFALTDQIRNYLATGQMP